MDLGMSREVQVSMPMPSNYPSIHDTSRLQIYNKSLGVLEGMSPPEDLRSQLQGMRPQVQEIGRPVVEDMRPHPPIAQQQYTEESMSAESMSNKAVRYRECKKNHAASIGGYAVDGCGEFMPSGEEGTPAALKCAACNCHRNFHRREVEGESRCNCHHTRRISIHREAEDDAK